MTIQTAWLKLPALIRFSAYPLRILGLIYLITCLYAWLGSDRRIFLPPDRALPLLGNEVELMTPSGLTISALYLPALADQSMTILYSHGNAEDLFALQNYCYEFQDRGFGILAYDYPGYGRSSGKPSEKTVYEAIVSAYLYLIETQNIPAQNILVYGRSLGGGPSTHLAAHYPVGGLILESTFVSIFRVVTQIRILPFDKFRNLAKLAQVEAPVLILHGTEDEIIPFWHGQALYQGLNRQSPSANLHHFEVIPQGNHNNLQELLGEAYWQLLDNFQNQILAQGYRR